MRQKLSRRTNTRLAIAALAIGAALSGCGDSGNEAPPAAGAGAPGAPALLERELGPGEFLVEGETTPHEAGPFRIDGRYRVSFAQYAPEAPRRSFAGQVPFVAELRSLSDPRARPVQLFHAAAKGGSRTIELHGRYAVEVLFGDFPFALRFSPAD